MDGVGCGCVPCGQVICAAVHELGRDMSICFNGDVAEFKDQSHTAAWLPVGSGATLVLKTDGREGDVPRVWKCLGSAASTLYIRGNTLVAYTGTLLSGSDSGCTARRQETAVFGPLNPVKKSEEIIYLLMTAHGPCETVLVPHRYDVVPVVQTVAKPKAVAKKKTVSDKTRKKVEKACEEEESEEDDRDEDDWEDDDEEEDDSFGNSDVDDLEEDDGCEDENDDDDDDDENEADNCAEEEDLENQDGVYNDSDIDDEDAEDASDAEAEEVVDRKRRRK